MSKKLKILYTIPNFDTAGSGKVVYDLVKGLDKSKFDVSIACSSDRGAFFKEVEKLGVPMHILQTTTSYKPHISLLSRVQSIAQFFRANKYDLIHSWHWSSDWTEALASRLSGAKWIYTKKAMSWGSKHWRIRSFMANFIITINDEMFQYFPKKKNKELIPLGIDTLHYSPENFEKPIRKENEFHIITVANLVPVKGVEVLINSIHHLQDPTIKLTVLGDNNNDYGKHLNSLCKNLKLDKQVTFMGKKKDVRPFVVASDIYIIPTLNEGRKEGMPMALVEAMCMGLPTVGSNISGIKYVLKDFPELLFPAGDVEKLSELIHSLKSKSPIERSEIGNQLRTYCINNFSMEQFLTAHEELYIKLTR